MTTRGKCFTEAEDETILEGKARGETFAQIAQRLFDRTPGSVQVRFHRLRHGHRGRVGGEPRT